MKIDFQESLNALPQPLTLARWTEMTHSEAVNKAVADFQHGDAAAKKRLPAVTWQASFAGKRRSNANAIPSGLYMLDLDHLEGNTAQIFTERIMPHVRECGILLVHTTPSGHGLRVVARMQRAQSFPTIREFQLWLAAQLGFKTEEVDLCTKDMARLSFVPPEPYVHFLDQRIFLDAPEYVVPSGGPASHVSSATMAKPKPKVKAATAETSGEGAATDGAAEEAAEAVNAEGAEEAGGVAGEGTAEALPAHRGIPLADIAQRLIELMFTEEIQEGTRNASLYKVARTLRYVCDFNPETMADALPHYGLDRAEVLTLCRSACESFRRTDLPPELTQAIDELAEERADDARMEAGGDDDDDEDEEEDRPEDDLRRTLSVRYCSRHLPPLPPLFKEYVGLCPPDFKGVQLLCMLPVVGTLCTGVRSTYLDGRQHSPSFLTVVTAAQASGKSFASNMYESLTRRLEAEDATNRAIEEAYRQELKSAKNAKEQPVDPRACIRLLPPSVSVAKLLQRLDYAGQRHLLTFAEEIDTLTKSNSSGAWAQKSDIYRNAFDNAKYGQDYMSDSSYSTVVRVFYNLLVMGTPRAVGRFFRDVEDGLVSRVIFAQIPSQAYKDMPTFRTFSADAEKRCDGLVEKLMEMNCGFDLDFLNKALHDWLQKRRLEALSAQNLALDTFRRRAAVMGFRAGLVARACYEAGTVDTKNTGTYRSRIRKFAIWVADYALASLLERFGAQMTSVQQETRATRRQGDNYVNLLSKLEPTFTSDTLRATMKFYGVKSTSRMVVHRWKANGLIEKVDGKKSTFRKIGKK